MDYVTGADGRPVREREFPGGLTTWGPRRFGTGHSLAHDSLDPGLAKSEQTPVLELIRQGFGGAKLVPRMDEGDFLVGQHQFDLSRHFDTHGA